MKDFSSLKQALKLADMGLETSPLSPDSKVPLIPLSQGGHGYKDSTNDKAKLNKMFSNAPQANLCLRLDTSHLIMVDVDLHTEQANGKETLVKLAKRGMELPTDTYIESTPHNGLHYYFKADVPIKDINEAFGKSSGVEIHTHSSSIYPSEIDGKQYEPLLNDKTGMPRTLDDIKPAPEWLISYINRQEQQTRHTVTYKPRIKKYTGEVLDRLVCGVQYGSRNTFLTQLTGQMFASGADPKTVYEMLDFANQHCEPPLSDDEMNGIFNSIIKREARRAQFAS